uniref:(northern house mosquito) hypothetical protein n=1 Tax=Culex pipiens TaxID=7175 RepID=A0A8D8G060_CULPI
MSTKLIAPSPTTQRPPSSCWIRKCTVCNTLLTTCVISLSTTWRWLTACTLDKSPLMITGYLTVCSCICARTWVESRDTPLSGIWCRAWKPSWTSLTSSTILATSRKTTNRPITTTSITNSSRKRRANTSRNTSRLTSPRTR